MKTKRPNIGGQAVIEGVMMRNGNKIATAVRTEKKIVVKTEHYNLPSSRYKILKLPFLRGMFSLFEMLYVGMKTLIYSANVAAKEEEEELTRPLIIMTLAISLLFAIGLFVFLPYFFTYLFGFTEKQTPLLFNIVDGIIKMGIFLTYLYLISKMKDIAIMFEYHGAEHKTVNAYEQNDKLTLKSVRKHSTIHKRCGTSFILGVVIIGVFFLSLIPVIAFNISGFADLHWGIRFPILFISRILFVPIIGGFVYEIMRASSKNDNWFFNSIAAPGMWVQKITTNEPNDKQLEVAIKAMKAVV